MNNNYPYSKDPLFSIEGRVYLIAGAGGGLGLPIAEELAKRGAKLVLFDIDAQALARAQNSAPGAIVEIADMGDEAAVSDLAILAMEQFGRLDGAVNAAGKLPIAPADEFEENIFRECIDINITAAFLFSRAVAKTMYKTGGRIVHIASVSSFVANTEYAAYAASKAGLSHLVRVLAREWAQRGVLVNAVGPALTETGLTRDYISDPEFKGKAISVIPMGRLGEPEDLFGTFLLLLSDAGSFITGQTIYVDGGRILV